MSHSMSSAPNTSVHRHRHRSRQRKLVESLALLLGVPALLFVVLALSVELIEYRPSGPLASSDFVIDPGSTSEPESAATVEEIPNTAMDGRHGLE